MLADKSFDIPDCFVRKKLDMFTRHQYCAGRAKAFLAIQGYLGKIEVCAK